MAEPGSFEFQENILLFRILVTQWPSIFRLYSDILVKPSFEFQENTLLFRILVTQWSSSPV